MAAITFRGVVRGGVVLFENETSLTDGTTVLVTPLDGPPVNGAHVVAALEKAPKVPAEWVDELDQLIAEGNRPPAPPVLFEVATEEPR